MKFKEFIKALFARNTAENIDFETPTDTQTLLCLEAARLSVEHIANF